MEAQDREAPSYPELMNRWFEVRQIRTAIEKGMARIMKDKNGKIFLEPVFPYEMSDIRSLEPEIINEQS